MTAESRQSRTGGLGASPSEREISDSYVEEFETRLAALNPLPETRRASKRLSTDGVELFAEKFTAAVFVAQYGKAEIFIGREKESGYTKHDHEDIRMEHGIWFGHYSAFLMTVGDKRLLSLPQLWYLTEGDIAKLKNVVHRYGITAVFTPRPNMSSTSVELKDIDMMRDNEIAISWMADDDYRKTIDDLVRDDWTSYVAQRYGLTNTELLRLRLTGKFPEDKLKPIGSAKL